MVGTLAELFYSEEYLNQGDNRRRVHEMLKKCGPPRDATLASAVVHRTGNTDDELARIGCRTLVLRGADDRVRFQNESDRLAAQIPRAHRPVISLAGSGHGVCAERSQAVIEELRKFLVPSP
jgi:pimeloyl-ACP methyl ester carboxylesterase